MQKHHESNGDKVPGLYHHKAGAMGTPATPGNIMMKQSKFCILLNSSVVLKPRYAASLVSTFSQLACYISCYLDVCLQTHIQLCLRLSLPACTRQK